MKTGASDDSIRLDQWEPELVVMALRGEMKREKLSTKTDASAAGRPAQTEISKPIVEHPEAGGELSPRSGALQASVDVLTLARGLYLFSARGPSPSKAGEKTTGPRLPAVQIGTAPGVGADQFEIMSGPQTPGAWLCDEDDAIVVKISAIAVPVLITSVKTAEMVPLEISVQSLNFRNIQNAAVSPTQRPLSEISTSAPMGDARRPTDEAVLDSIAEDGRIPLQILAHIQNRGDVSFKGGALAGMAGKHLAIEGFSVSPLGQIVAEQLEYKAVNATKNETPWVKGGEFCGTRGKGLPLVGFCMRVKPRNGGKRYDCEYSGVFASGKTIGPVKNGAPCWSNDAGDFIEAIQVKIVERPSPNVGKAA